nr:AAA family ATPase [Paracoccaceae bacterium]
MQFSDDQTNAYDKILEVLSESGIDIKKENISPLVRNKNKELTIVGKAGSGKTLLLAKIVSDLNQLGVETVSGDYQPTRTQKKRTLAILAPTNKAASVIRQQGVAATTIHRILYTPIYDPEYEKIADWLNGKQEKPIIAGLSEDALKRAEAFFKVNKSIPGALA